MQKRFKTSSMPIALLGIFAALTVALSALEHVLPSLPVPGVRFGLSNVALTAAMAMMGRKSALPLAAVKVLFVLLLRGTTAALMAGCGTVLSVLMTAIVLPLALSDRPFSFVGVCVASAAVHTFGQLLCATWLMTSAVWSLAPLLFLWCIPTGSVTGYLLNMIVPRIRLILIDMQERM